MRYAERGRGGMLSRKPILSALVVLTAAYVAYPYMAVYRLGEALRSGNSAALAAMIDWDRVRDGLTADICEQIDGKPAGQADTQQASNELPPFGASFVKGIASTAVDATVTPEALVQMVGHEDVAPGGAPEALRTDALRGGHVEWAFFDGPRRFVLSVRMPTEALGEKPVKVRMELLDGRWKVTRIWLPPSLLRPGVVADATK